MNSIITEDPCFMDDLVYLLDEFKEDEKHLGNIEDFSVVFSEERLLESPMVEDPLVNGFLIDVGIDKVVHPETVEPFEYNMYVQKFVNLSEVYCPSNESREEKLQRYRNKKKNRKYTKPVSYESRKNVADRRPRINGRFVSSQVEFMTIRELHARQKKIWKSFII